MKDDANLRSPDGLVHLRIVIHPDREDTYTTRCEVDMDEAILFPKYDVPELQLTHAQVTCLACAAAPPTNGRRR